MAVEIRELVIRALIVQDGAAQTDSGRKEKTEIRNDRIVQECVNQVLKIIRQNKNR